MPLELPSTRKLALPALMVLLVLVVTGCQGGAEDFDGFKITSSYTLRAGEQRAGDQVILAGTIVLEAGSVVDGDITLMGEKVTLNGEVRGEAIAVADRLTVGEGAHITGDLTVCAKNLERSDVARIDGQVREECNQGGRASVANAINSGWESWRSSTLFRMGAVITGSLFFGALSALLTAILPRPLVRMSESIYRAPVVAGGVGILTMLAAIGLTVVYGVSLLLILPLVLLPLVIIAWLVIGALSVLGWVALAGPFGVALLRRAGLEGQPCMVAAAIGGVALSLLLRVWSVFWFTAWIGLLATALLGAIGLGAVLLTRVGTRPYPRRDAVPGR
ncbi:MAG: polymer-forming cytoskeletal protein [Chloroflexota bacterium]